MATPFFVFLVWGGWILAVYVIVVEEYIGVVVAGLVWCFCLYVGFMEFKVLTIRFIF